MRAVILQVAVYAVFALFGSRPNSAPTEKNLSARRRYVVEWLPNGRRSIVERVLTGWRGENLPATAFPDKTPAREQPGAYVVAYALEGSEAKVWVLYSAANERLAVRDNGP